MTPDDRSLVPSGGYEYPTIAPHLQGIVVERALGLVSQEEGEPVLMSWTPADTIPAAHRAWVQRHADKAATMLGLGPVKVLWFGPFVGRAPLTGYAPAPGLLPVGIAPEDRPGCIAINAFIRGPKVAAVVAHECRHLAQRKLLERLSDPYENEVDADAFALEYVGREVPE